MKSKFIKFVFVIMMVLMANGAWGADYYVRTDGSDTNCIGTADASDASTETTQCAWLTVGTAGVLNYNNFRNSLSINSVTTAMSTNDFNVDPQFVSTTDLKLKISSPMINAGTFISGFHETATDYLGRPIKGLPDIGAYEYQGGRATTGTGGTITVE